MTSTTQYLRFFFALALQSSFPVFQFQFFFGIVVVRTTSIHKTFFLSQKGDSHSESESRDIVKPVSIIVGCAHQTLMLSPGPAQASCAQYQQNIDSNVCSRALLCCSWKTFLVLLLLLSIFCSSILFRTRQVPKCGSRNNDSFAGSSKNGYSYGAGSPFGNFL